MDKLEKVVYEIGLWSDKTFGSSLGIGRARPIIHHLKKEVPELIEALEELEKLSHDPGVGVGEYGRAVAKVKKEYADCFMLLYDSARVFGLEVKDIPDIMTEKLEINKNREWGKPDENGVVEHLKD